MLSFLTLVLVALVGFSIAGMFALPFIVLAGLLWLVMLPLKLLFGFVFGGVFRLAFGVFGAALSVLVVPLLMVAAGVALLGALLAGLVALLAPLVPVALLILLGWAMYRLGRPKAAL